MSYMSRVSDDLLAKEEEYHRLNAEIEQKTKQLVDEVASMSYEEESSLRQSLSTSLNTEVAENLLSKLHLDNKPTSPSQDTENKQPQESVRLSRSDVIDDQADELGPESQLRLLKAKVRVLEEEIERVTKDLSKKKQDLSEVRQNLKAEREEKLAIQKTCLTTQAQVKKYVTLLEEKKNKSKTLETEIVRLRKDIETQERAGKKSSQYQKILEVRLDRALQELERYKGLLTAAKSQASEVSSFDREAMGKLQAENKILEKQKAELINAYKKQMKLIDVLRKQKLHLEASRMLDFTQEEFMKVLDWKS